MQCLRTHLLSSMYTVPGGHSHIFHKSRSHCSRADSPRLESSSRVVEADVGRSANLSCTAQSNPPATVSWTRMAPPGGSDSGAASAAGVGSAVAAGSAMALRVVPLDSGARGHWVLVPVAGEAEYQCAVVTDDPRLRTATGTVHVLIRGMHTNTCTVFTVFH